MSLLKSDLSRNFAIGFVLGAAIVAVQVSSEIAGGLPQALAAIVLP